jgi:phage shock protein PspC (stress-responsive transcriptional regulator)
MNKLYRSRSERVIAGVAGGLGRYLRIEPILVRLFFILLALGDGIGVLLYIILALVIPEAPESAVEALEVPDAGSGVDERRSTTLIGGGLLLLGMFFLMQTLNVPFFPWFGLEELWPLLLIAAGAALLWRQHQEQQEGV